MREEPPIWRVLLPIAIMVAFAIAVIVGGYITYSTKVTYL